MAQAMMAIIMLRPDSARARPSTLLNSDVEYKKIFSLDKPIDIYLKTVQIMKTVEGFLKSENCSLTLERKVITNIKFYVAMVVAIKLVDSKNNIENKLSLLPTINIPGNILESSLTLVINEFNQLGSSDQVAKGSTLLGKLLSALNN
jgi:hypothetical protein